MRQKQYTVREYAAILKAVMDPDDIMPKDSPVLDALDAMHDERQPKTRREVRRGRWLAQKEAQSA